MKNLETSTMTKQEAERLAELVLGVTPRYRDSGLGKILVEIAEAPLDTEESEPSRFGGAGTSFLWSVGNPFNPPY